MAETQVFFGEGLGIAEAFTKAAYDKSARTLNNSLNAFFEHQIEEAHLEEIIKNGPTQLVNGAAVPSLTRDDAFKLMQEQHWKFNRDEYKQYNVKDRKDLDSLVYELRQNGYNDITYTPKKIGDAYVLLVPERAEEVVNTYTDTYDCKVTLRRDEEIEVSDHSDDRDSRYHSLILNNMDTFGAAWNNIFNTYAMLDNHINESVTIRVDGNNELTFWHKDQQITFDIDGHVFRGHEFVEDKTFAASLRESYLTAKRKAEDALIERVPSLKKYRSTDGVFEAARKHIKEGDSDTARAVSDVFSNKINGMQAAIKRDHAKYVNASRYTLGAYQTVTERIAQEDKLFPTARVKLADGTYDRAMTTREALASSFKGMVAANQPISASLIAKMNKEFLMRANQCGINLTTRGGNFDIKKFDALSESQWEKLGITNPKAQNVLREINGKGNGLGLTGASYKKALVKKGIVKGISDDEDTMQVINTSTRGARLGKDTVKEYRRKTEAARYKKTAKALDNAKTGGELSTKPVAQKEKKKLPEMSAKQKARQKKLADKTEKKVEKTIRKRNANSMSNRLHNLSNRWKKRLSENGVGKVLGKMTAAGNKVKAKLLAKVAPFFLKIILISMIPLVVVIILMTIANFLERAVDAVGGVFGKIDAESYEESAFYCIYEALDEAEEKWADSLYARNLHNKEIRDAALYGTRYVSWSRYLESKGAYFYQDESGHIRSLPFGPVSYTPNPVVSFDGADDTKILTNDNIFNATDTDEFGTPKDAATAQTGHTSNIKDILAMVDVMYGHELQNGSNNNMASLTGKTPYGLNWENFKAKMYNAFLWCKLKILSWFSSDDDEEDRDWYEEYMERKRVTVGYKAVLSYALTLFTISHQTRIDVDIDYYKVVPEADRAKMEGLSQLQASQAGYCITPDEVDLYLTHTHKDGKIHPSFTNGRDTETDVGRYQAGRNNEFDADIPMSQMKLEETACIWDGIKANKGTYDIINDSKCWKITSSQTLDQSGTTYLTTKNGVTTDLREMTLPVISNTKPDDGALDRILADEAWQQAIQKIQVNIVTQTRVAYQNKKKAGAFGSTYSLALNATNYQNGSGAELVDRFIRTQPKELPKDSDFYVVEDKDGDGKVRPSEVRWDYTLEWKPFTVYDAATKTNRVLFYLGTLTVRYRAPQILMSSATYVRRCVGHTFEYCGGHLCTHATGVVYSITNEQLAMCDVGNYQPIALDMDLKASGYDEIEGKIDEHALTRNKTASVESLKGSAPGKTMWASAQGSFIGGYGLNLYVTYDKNGKAYWGEGLNPRSTHTDDFCLMRDIFDVDTFIEKGCNVFPLRYPSEFEGWTATNMTLAIGKMGIDWLDVYGFDIPTSLGGQTPITKTAIEDIVAELRVTYGDAFTAEREIGVRTALSYIGTGVYLDDSMHQHSYLTSKHRCKTVERQTGNVIDYSVSCAAGNEDDFLTYLWKSMGGLSGKSVFPDNSGGRSPWVGNHDNRFNMYILPGDILHYDGTDSWLQQYMSEEEKKSDLYVRARIGSFTDYAEYGSNSYFYGDRSVFFIGVLAHPVVLGYKDGGGQYTIPAGVPITLELQRYGGRTFDGYGSVYLHYDTSDTISSYYNHYIVYPYFRWHYGMPNTFQYYNGTVTYYRFQKAN